MDIGTGIDGGGRGAISSESTPLSGLAGEDMELPLPGTSGNSGSEGDEFDGDEGPSFSGSGSSDSGTSSAQEMRWDRRFEARG
jgi:hypothetical protein